MQIEDPLVADSPIAQDPWRGLLRSRAAVTHFSTVRIFHAAECSLCARALEVVHEVQAELVFELELVDIGGVEELEARYRELLPVVEIDGDVAFTYFIDPDALRERLRPVPSAAVERPQAES